MKQYFLIGFFSILLIACDPPKKKVDPKIDDSLYELVGKGFYKGKKDGKTYIRTIGRDNPNDTSEKMRFYYRTVPEIDISSFQRLGHGGYYAKDKKSVYAWITDGTGSSIIPVTGAKVNEFNTFAYQWGMDSAAVYFKGKKLNGLDPTSIRPICSDDIDTGLVYVDFVVDKDQLFYGDMEIKVPGDLNLLQLGCKADLLGNSFLSVGEQLYIIKSGVLEKYD